MTDPSTLEPTLSAESPPLPDPDDAAADNSLDAFPDPERPSTADLPSLLRWAGLALITVYVVSVLSVAIPVQLVQPLWLVKITNALRSGASFALEGAVLVALAEFLDPASPELARWSRRIRRGALLAAVGFVLMIPLQVFAGFALRFVQDEQEQLVIKKLRLTEKAIAKARTVEDMTLALAQLPGQQRMTSQITPEVLESARSQLLYQIRPQIGELDAQLTTQRLARWSPVFGDTARDSLITLAYGVAFAAVARRAKDSASLLDRLLQRRNPRTLSAAALDAQAEARDRELEEQELVAQDLAEARQRYFEERNDNFDPDGEGGAPPQPQGGFWRRWRGGNPQVVGFYEEEEEEDEAEWGEGSGPASPPPQPPLDSPRPTRSRMGAVTDLLFPNRQVVVDPDWIPRDDEDLEEPDDAAKRGQPPHHGS